MTLKHSRDEARTAKNAAVAEFGRDSDVTGVGLGKTKDGTDWAVVINVATRQALARLPRSIQSIPVLPVFTGTNRLF